MNFAIRDAADADAAVEYFNAFHDGFIRSLTVASDDEFEDRHTHRTTGPLRLELRFAHNNYRNGEPPFDQLVEATFYGVRDLEISFTGRATDWPITVFTMEGASTSEGTSDPPVLRASLVQPRLIDGSRWEAAEAISFSFERAVVNELGSSDAG